MYAARRQEWGSSTGTSLSRKISGTSSANSISSGFSDISGKLSDRSVKSNNSSYKRETLNAVDEIVHDIEKINGNSNYYYESTMIA